MRSCSYTYVCCYADRPAQNVTVTLSPEAMKTYVFCYSLYLEHQETGCFSVIIKMFLKDKFIQLLTATCNVERIENGENHKNVISLTITSTVCPCAVVLYLGTFF